MRAWHHVNAVLLLLAALARADGPPPTLVAVHVGDTPVTAASPGLVIVLVGRDLHACPPLPERLPGDPLPRNTCRHEELSLDLEGEAWDANPAGRRPLLLINSNPDRMTTVVPADAPIGRYDVVVSIRGRGEARLPLEVVLLESICGDPDPPPPPFAPPPVAIDRFTRSHGAHGATFEVSGPAAPIPDGFSVVVTLAVDSRDIEQHLVSVTDGRFEARFGPYDRELLAGRYRALMTFELGKQPRVVSRRFVRTLRPGESQLFHRLERTAWLDVGTADDAARQRAVVQEKVRRFVDDLVLLVQESDGWRARAIFARLTPPFGARPPRFDPRAYQAWAATRLESELERLRKAWLAAEGLTVIPVNPFVRLRLDRLFSLVADWSQALALEKRVEPTSRARFEHERGALLRFVGLDD